MEPCYIYVFTCDQCHEASLVVNPDEQYAQKFAAQFPDGKDCARCLSGVVRCVGKVKVEPWTN